MFDRVLNTPLFEYINQSLTAAKFEAYKIYSKFLYLSSP